MGVRERKVEHYLDEQVTSHGGLTRKWVSPGRDGVPDRIVIYQGNVYFVEVKTVDGELSKNQEREHKRLTKVGGQVYTLYGHDEIDTWVHGVMLK